MLIDYFRIAFRNIARRRLRSWLTLIGIVIGITAVVSLISMGEGLRTAIMSQFGDLGTDKLAIQASGGFGPPGTAVVKPLTTADLRKIENVNGVQRAAGRLVSSTRIEHENEVGFGMVMSLPDGEGRSLVIDTLNLDTAAGRIIREEENDRVTLGYTYSTGDSGFDVPVQVGDRLLINDKPFIVAGIFERQGSFLFDNAILMNEAAQRDTFEIDKDQIDLIAVQVRDEEDMPAVKERIERLLRKERDVKEGEEDFTVSTPQQVLEQVGSILFGVQVFVGLIASISIMVGAIGIMNTMFTSVLERTKHIGIMKSIGAKNNTIFLLFFIESGFIGLVGGILGAALGAGGALLLAKIAQVYSGVVMIQADPSMMVILFAILGSFLIGSLSGLVPAWQASKMSPVEALRYAK